MPTDATLKSLIVTQVGDDADGVISANIDLFWDLHSDKPSQTLQFLYAKREAIDTLMGKERKKVNYSADGLQVSLSDKLKNLIEMRETVQDSIDQAEKKKQKSRAPAIGTITKTAPIPQPASSGIDANRRRLRGDAYPIGPDEE